MKLFDLAMDKLFGQPNTLKFSDYKSKRRWFVYIVLHPIRSFIYSAIITPLDKLEFKLERLSSKEFDALKNAAIAELGGDFDSIEYKLVNDPDGFGDDECIDIQTSIMRGEWTEEGYERWTTLSDAIESRAKLSCPSLCNARIAFNLISADNQ